MDDPIFDPWSSEPDPEDSEAPTEQDDTSPQDPRSRGRWQSPGARTPLGRPKPVDRSVEPEERDPGPTEAARADRPTKAAPNVRTTDVERTTEVEAAPDESGAAPSAPALATAVGESGLSGQLRETVVPRVEWLSSRLRIAGHETAVDDRLGAVVPSLRLRLVPRRYPLTEDGDDASAVLEVTMNERRAEVAARLWLDPMATGPTEDVRIHAAQLTDAWIDRMLLEFVERTLEDA
jgi:hypothetical protein